MKSVKEVHCFGARPSCWWFSGTCEALVAHLGKPELLRSCRLVQPVGENGAFSLLQGQGRKGGAVRIFGPCSRPVSLQDNEKLNGRRALLVLGIPSLRHRADRAWCRCSRIGLFQASRRRASRRCARREKLAGARSIASLQKGSLFCDPRGEASPEPRSKPQVGRCGRSFDELCLFPVLCFAGEGGRSPATEALDLAGSGPSAPRQGRGRRG